MSDGVHLIFPFAVRSDAACREALRGLALPQLSQLLVRMHDVAFDEADAASLSPPHERALARALGWPVADGLLPWAAQDALAAGLPGSDAPVPDAATQDPPQPGDAWAWVTPCHWRVGADHIAMALPQDVPLDDAEADAFLAAMQPWFAGDGITLVRRSAQRWLARGTALRDLPTASIDRVAGRDIDPWVPRAPAARPLRRLQQEMQMLLYTHPLNDARTARGLLPVNSFWISGTGALPPSPRPGDGVRLVDALADPALRADWPAWRDAWQRIDAEVLGPLVPALRQGQPLTLTLCGDRAGRTWSAAGTGFWHRATAPFRSAAPAAMMESL